jgi:hypothetical protein
VTAAMGLMPGMVKWNRFRSPDDTLFLPLPDNILTTTRQLGSRVLPLPLEAVVLCGAFLA